MTIFEFVIMLGLFILWFKTTAEAVLRIDEYLKNKEKKEEDLHDRN